MGGGWGRGEGEKPSVAFIIRVGMFEKHRDYVSDMSYIKGTKESLRGPLGFFSSPQQIILRGRGEGGRMGGREERGWGEKGGE